MAEKLRNRGISRKRLKNSLIITGRQMGVSLIVTGSML
jgi:hypothetical protein